MTLFLGALLAVAALAALAYPIVRRNATPAQDAAMESGGSLGLQPNQEQLDELLAQRESAVQALRELSFDRQVGKITDEDFGVFETNLKLTAAGTFRALDEWEADADRRLGPALTRDYTIRLESLKQGLTCSSCGRRAGAHDQFCAFCGAPLPSKVIMVAPAATATACTGCGRLSEPGDRFCAGCGRPLPQPESLSVN
jgi:Double zinc ribbon